MIYKELLDEGYIDEIDAVRRAFESPNLAELDWLSDKYFQLVALATSPTMFSDKIASIDRRKAYISERRPLIEAQLGHHGLLEVFDGHMSQVEHCIVVDFAKEESAGLVA